MLTDATQLETELSTTLTPSRRVYLLNRLAEVLRRSELERAFALAQEAGSITVAGDAAESQQARADSCTVLSMLHTERGDYDSAARFASEALGIYSDLDATADQLRAMAALSAAKMRTGGYPQSLELELKQLELAEQLGDRRAMGNALNGIGIIYSLVGDHREALEHHQKALNLFRDVGDSEREEIALTNCSMDARNLEQYDAALGFGLEGLHLAQNAGLADEYVLVSVGEAYMALEQLDDAEACFERSLVQTESSGRALARVNALRSLGELMIRRGDDKVALEKLRDAVVLAEELGEKNGLMRCHKSLHHACKNLGEFETALHHAEAHHQIKEELLGEQANIRLRRLQVRHRTDAARREARLVQEKNLELEHLNYAISHDLKGPLLTIRAFADLLEADLSGDDPERIRSDVDRIRNAAMMVQKRIGQLTELARVRRVDNPPREVGLEVLVREVIESLEGAIQKQGATVVISDGLPVIKGDPLTLVHVFQNLIENGLKFARHGCQPEIEIGAIRDGVANIFYVKDNGLGIDSAYLHKVFGLFERLDPEIEGSGVGLTVVKRVIENHGGTVWIESDGRTGSTVFFTLRPIPIS